MSLLSPLESLSHDWIPLIIGTLIVIAIIIMGLVVGVTFFEIKKAAEHPPPAPLPPKEEPLATPISIDRLPPASIPFSSALALKGFFKVGELSLSFFKALRFLKEHLDTYNYKYHLPWYLLIGPSHCGKTTLIESSELNFPLGRTDFSGGEVHPTCNWWFLNKAVLLDIRGDFLIKERGVQSEERGWRGLLALLARYRSLKPIDGIILCLPADELYGQWKLSREEIQDRARFLGQKLRASQGDLSLRLPVYIVITKCDLVAGFQNLCTFLPQSHRHDILGWSSPYTIDTAFQPKWVEEAFLELDLIIRHLRLELFAAGNIEGGADGLFVLPHEIHELKELLSIYICTIFRESSYEESLLLRGIYFTGKAQEQQNNFFLEHLFASSEDPPTSESLGEQAAQVRIYFSNHIFNERIFRESGLAEPIYNRLITANRNLNIAKAGIGTFVTLGTLGVLHNYDVFTKQRDFLIPTLNQLTATLRELQVARVTMSHSSKFSSYTQEMTEIMGRLSKVNFFSIFSPPSWFSGIDANLRHVLGVAYQEIVVRSLYFDLLLKAKGLLNPPAIAQEKTTSMAQLLQPTTMPEMQRFKAFVESFVALILNIERYNQLPKATDASSLAELVHYAFDAQIPRDFDSYYRDFGAIFRKVPTPSVDVRNYIFAAKQRLVNLYNEFVNALMSPSNPQSLLGRINEIVHAFSHTDNSSIPDVTILRRFTGQTTPTIDSLGMAGSTWLDAAYFSPGEEFDEIMNQITQSPLFGPQLVTSLAQETSKSFNTLQMQLQKLDLILRKRGPQNSSPSQSLFDLNQCLASLLKEPFMTPVIEATFYQHTPPEKMLILDPKLIDAAVAMTQAYEEFINKTIDTYPPLLQTMLKLVAAKNLQANIISNIARAENFVDLPQGQNKAIVSEEVLQTKLQTDKELGPKLLTLLKALKKDEAGETFTPLRNMLAEASYQLLNYVEAVLQSYAPYMIKDNNFDWWDGQEQAAYAAYGVKDDVDLKSYLKIQLDRMNMLGLLYSEPIVTFLTMPIMQEAQIDQTLVNRWQRIVEQLKLQEKQRPESSVRVVEEFITKDLNNITLSNCFNIITLDDIKESSGDFFLNIKQTLRRKMLARCEVLQRSKALDNYQRLVDFFNTNLKGKFPFVGKDVSGETQEAEPQDLRGFFNLYKQAGDNPKVILNQVYQLGADAKGAIDFLENMESIKIFFKSYLEDESVPVPFCDFTVDFRVNTANESGAQNIMDWYFMPSNTKKITNFDDDNTGRWSFNNPVEVGFRWPDGINIKPFRDTGNPYMTVSDLTAVYRFEQRWALLWLLKSQQASPIDLGGSLETKPYVLRFKIPVGPDKNALVFIRITLSSPPKGQAPGKLLKLPNFPTSAPNLPKSAIALRYKPVLTNGSIKATEIPDTVFSEDNGATASTGGPSA